MATAEQSSTETLFHHWRRGDAEAGKAMAQRFTDWYYAISVARLGETQAEEPFRTACSKFSKGVVKVTDPRRLLGWAHNIARKQLHTRVDGGWITSGDLPNAFSRKRSPTELLLRARTRIPQQMRVLERAYRDGLVPDDPFEVLQARYELKAWLRDQAEAPFRVVPKAPDRDRTPLPFYEAARMDREVEEIHFELYMLNETDVCQDVAEFAHFAIALRGGLPGETPAADASPPQGSQRPTSPDAGKSAATVASTPAAKPPPPAPAAPPPPAPVAPPPTSQQRVPSEHAPSNTPFTVALVVGLVLLFGVMWALAQYYAK
jgi:hypothetical protein